jgi:hypothetical protein
MGIAVLAKAPIAGSAKTRLIPLLGETGAAELHQQLTFQALETACAASLGNVTLFTASEIDHPFFSECVRRFGVTLVPQQGNDIGERMLHAIQHLKKALSCVLLIGTDCPALTPDNLRVAANSLHGQSRMVFIPAEDGGYVLVGATDVAPIAFSDVNWGTSDVMRQTRQQLSSIGWKQSRDWQELPALWDVDLPDDYRRAVSTGYIRDAFIHSAGTGR